MAEILRICIDYGTTKGKVAWAYMDPSSTPDLRNVHLVEFRSRCYYFPMHVGYDSNQRLQWGHELSDLLERNSFPAQNLIESLKLSLYEDDSTTEFQKNVQDALPAGKTKEDILTDHLRVVYEKALEEIGQSEWVLQHGLNIRTVQKQVRISVPIKWNPKSNLLMAAAASRAGFGISELVLEPIAATAFTLATLEARHGSFPTGLRTNDLRAGTVLQVADCGGGTTDHITVRMQHELSAKARGGLKTVGNPQGGLHGSNFINKEFLGWIETSPAITQHGTLQDACDYVGLDIHTFQRKASREFDKIKSASSWSDVSSMSVVVRNGDKDTMKRLADPTIEKVIETTIQQYRSTPAATAVLLTGGFSHCNYLVRKLRDALRRVTGKEIPVFTDFLVESRAVEPVVCGSLLRYADILPREIPLKFSFGIARREDWEPSKHPDASYFWKQADRDDPSIVYGADQTKKSFRAKPDLGVVTYEGNKEVVEGRWAVVLKKGRRRKNKLHQVIGSTKWMIHHFPPDESEVSQTLYWTEKDMKEHEAIFERRQEDSGAQATLKLRHGIHEWQTLTCQFDPSQYNYTLKVPRGFQDQVYEVYSRVVAESNPPNAQAKWQFLKAGRAKIKKDGTVRKNFKSKPDDVAVTKEFLIQSGQYRPFPRNPRVRQVPETSGAAESDPDSDDPLQAATDHASAEESAGGEEGEDSERESDDDAFGEEQDGDESGAEDFVSVASSLTAR